MFVATGDFSDLPRFRNDVRFLRVLRRVQHAMRSAGGGQAAR